MYNECEIFCKVHTVAFSTQTSIFLYPDAEETIKNKSTKLDFYLNVFVFQALMIMVCSMFPSFCLFVCLFDFFIHISCNTSLIGSFIFCPFYFTPNTFICHPLSLSSSFIYQSLTHHHHHHHLYYYLTRLYSHFVHTKIKAKESACPLSLWKNTAS
jgi:hypothetical protein